MTLIYPIIAAVLSALLEGVRIKMSHGKVANINKMVTYSVGAILFAVCIDLSTDYYDNILPHHVLCYLIYFAAVRGVVYDPLLNRLRGLPIDYKSASTNSIIDRLIGNRVNFLLLRLFYFAISIIFGFIWLYLLRNI